MKTDNAGNELNEYGFRKDFDWKTRFDLKTDVGDYVVSTVDLGLDHSFGDGPPLYYETMIFKKKDDKINFSEIYCDRYSTEEQAIEGHKKAIEVITKIITDMENNNG